jgi:hypothetical protein
MTDLHSLSVAQLHQVVAIKEKIEALQSELDAIVGGTAPSVEAPAPASTNGRRTRHMSASARARIAAAQKRRWAKVRAAKGEEAAPVKKKRRISAATRARLAAMVKARWAKAKASGKSKL